MSPRLVARGLTITLGGRPLVGPLDFDIAAGEMLGLVGESGSGKSITALALLGLAPASAQVEGSVRLDGQELVGASESALAQVRGARAGIVFQEPATALNPLVPVGEQVAEVFRIHRLARGAAARERARAVLERVGLGADVVPDDRFPHELSGGQRQRVAIAIAIAARPALLVADEPTTALDVTTQAQILELMQRLATEDGMATLLISHDLALVAGAARRIAILRDGRLVEQGAVASLLSAPAEDYTRALVRDFSLPPCQPTPPPPGPALLVATGVGRSMRRPGSDRPILSATHLSLAPGERVGLVGESGSGKSTLVRILLGLDAPDQGSVTVSGLPYGAGSAAERRARRRLVQAVFQDPVASLDPQQRLASLVAEPLHLLDPKPHGIERERRVAAALAAVGLGAASPRALPHEFSGGQRQRIALARALVAEPAILILDEAVSALDASTRSQVLDLLVGLWRDRGLGYLFVTHDLSVVRAVTDRILVLRQGEVVESGPTARILDHPEHPYTQALVAATPLLERLIPAQRARTRP